MLVENVIKSYGPHRALDGVSFNIAAGEKWALLGPNGAGKSTTLKLLAGLMEPDSGIVRIAGMNPATQNEAKRLVGYLPEDATPYRSLSVRENLEYIAALRGVSDPSERVGRLLDFLELAEYEKAKVSRLSRGNTQKLAVALAIVHDPSIFLLDEPLNYLDIPTQEKVINLLQSKQATQLVSTHIMAIASRLTDKVLMMSHGKVVWTGTLPQLRALGSESEPVEAIVARMMTNAV
ncbi:MAG: ABC transporter ATP-binding protein [Thermoprotei archaeon]